MRSMAAMVGPMLQCEIIGLRFRLTPVAGRFQVFSESLTRAATSGCYSGPDHSGHDSLACASSSRSRSSSTASVTISSITTTAAGNRRPNSRRLNSRSVSFPLSYGIGVLPIPPVMHQVHWRPPIPLPCKVEVLVGRELPVHARLGHRFRPSLGFAMTPTPLHFGHSTVDLASASIASMASSRVANAKSTSMQPAPPTQRVFL